MPARVQPACDHFGIVGQQEPVSIRGGRTGRSDPGATRITRLSERFLALAGVLFVAATRMIGESDPVDARRAVSVSYLR